MLQSLFNYFYISVFIAINLSLHACLYYTWWFPSSNSNNSSHVWKILCVNFPLQLRLKLIRFFKTMKRTQGKRWVQKIKRLTLRRFQNPYKESLLYLPPNPFIPILIVKQIYPWSGKHTRCFIQKTKSLALEAGVGVF